MNLSSRNQQGGVSVTEKTETVRKGVAVYPFPVTVYKGRNQQEQSAPGLMEISYHHLDDVVFVARSYYYLCACLEYIQMMAVKIIQYAS